ncbi:hypothetical protein HOC01_06260 [archaeon]|jgi:hypothetical protein|nr:hypothetical protein [archaeon]MBT6697555.1 hypothetical protein [archaeon]
MTDKTTSKNINLNQSNRPFRIITHSKCTDGLFSAWIMKRYFNEILNLKKEEKLTKKQIEEIPVIGTQAYAIQKDDELEFTPYDIVLDLPKPDQNIFFWCDHHSSNKPQSHEEVKLANQKHHFEIADSNTGLLINLAIKHSKQNKTPFTKKQLEELEQFKVASDIMDMAKYNKKQIQNCYYLKENLEKYNQENASALLKSHILSSFVHSRDYYLTTEFLKFTANSAADTNSITPLNDQNLWDLKPHIWHIARLKGHKEWRKQLDTFVEFDEETKMVIVDKRKIRKEFGLFDRFYVYLKFPEAIYNLNLKITFDGNARLGLGANIFEKDKRKLDVGETLKELSKLHGEGSGGGHAAVGGATVFENNADLAIAFIKEKIKEAHK